MNRLPVIVVSACLLASAGAARAQSQNSAGPPSASAQSSDRLACDSPYQSGLNACAAAGAKDADAELNRIYGKVLAANAADTEFVAKFRAAQRAWVAFRDAQIAARYPHPDDYGSVQPMCQSGEYEQLTRDRIKQLNEWIKGTEEGDVCAGSYPTH